jgi:hypothetical protein
MLLKLEGFNVTPSLAEWLILFENRSTGGDGHGV